jgi:hypothetical protein
VGFGRLLWEARLPGPTTETRAEEGGALTSGLERLSARDFPLSDDRLARFRRTSARRTRYALRR